MLQSEVPLWFDEHSLPSAEDIRLETAIEHSGFSTDYGVPREYSFCRRRCRKLCLGFLSLVVLVTGLSMVVTRKGPAQIIEEAEYIAEEFVPRLDADSEEGEGGGEFGQEDDEDEFGDPFGDKDASGGAVGNGVVKDVGFFFLASPGFEDGKSLPQRYGSFGDNISPALTWSGVPNGTVSLVLTLDQASPPKDVVGVSCLDVECKTERSHWVLYDIPPKLGGLPEGLEKTWEVLIPSDDLGVSQTLRQGLNSHGSDLLARGAPHIDPVAMKGVGYFGPDPPGSGVIVYYFRLYAVAGLIRPFHSKNQTDAQEVDRQTVIDQARSIGVLAQQSLKVTYERQ